MSQDNFVDEIVNLIIRPPRSKAPEFPDGEFEEPFSKKKVNLKKFVTRNRRNLNVKAILIYPLEISLGDISKLPVVIYSHGNMGNMSTGVSVLTTYFLPQTCGISLTYSGNSDGEAEYVTLGFEERYDLLSVVNYARDIFKFTKIGMFGRSQGAASTLLCTGLLESGQTLVKGIVLDSPYARLSVVADNFAKFSFSQKQQFSQEEQEKWFEQASEIVKQKTGLVISEFNTVECAKRSNIPLLILHGRQDALIPLSEGQEVLAAYGCGDKTLVDFDGEHHTQRSAAILGLVPQFFERVFGN